ncbi:MAG: hypothetical protein ACFFGZ_07735 [Candidatus Thorarchaeota archaeon]
MSLPEIEQVRKRIYPTHFHREACKAFSMRITIIHCSRHDFRGNRGILKAEYLRKWLFNYVCLIRMVSFLYVYPVEAGLSRKAEKKLT